MSLNRLLNYIHFQLLNQSALKVVILILRYIFVKF